MPSCIVFFSLTDVFFFLFEYIALLSVVTSLFMAALGPFLCSLAKQVQPLSHRFYIPESDHLLNFPAEEKIERPTEHDAQLFGEARELQ
jgi:hypothetical protein